MGIFRMIKINLRIVLRVHDERRVDIMSIDTPSACIIFLSSFVVPSYLRLMGSIMSGIS